MYPVHQCVPAGSSTPAVAKEELEPVGRVTVRGTGHRTVTSPHNNAGGDDDDDDDGGGDDDHHQDDGGDDHHHQDDDGGDIPD